MARVQEKWISAQNTWVSVDILKGFSLTATTRLNTLSPHTSVQNSGCAPFVCMIEGIKSLYTTNVHYEFSSLAFVNAMDYCFGFQSIFSFMPDKLIVNTPCFAVNTPCSGDVRVTAFCAY